MEEPQAGQPYRWPLVLFYTSHFLFTWNDRVWEFASVILLISAYPQTLQPSSIFGLASTAVAIVFSPAVGRWFDMTPRLKSVRYAIFTQRVGVSAGCVCLWAMVSQSLGSAKDGLFAVVILLGCIARLAFVGKTVGIERDWAIVISKSRGIDLSSTSRSSSINLDMNAVMRRIDLFCKLAGPLFVSVLTIPSASFAAIFLASSNILSLPFEYYFIHVVHKRFPDLADKPAPPEHMRQPLIRQFLQWPQRTLLSWKIYYRSPLFSASLSLCILYFTVLSFGGNHVLNFANEGSMIAFLSQYSDFSTPLVAGLRAIAVVVGIAATFISSPVIRWIGPVRSGIWFLSWQTIFLSPVPVALFLALNKRLQGGLLVGFVSISRLGLWGFDLSEQYLVQQVAHPLYSLMTGN